MSQKINYDIKALDTINAVLTTKKSGFKLLLNSEKTTLLQKVRASFKFDFLPQDKLFLNGYQGWTFSYEKGIYDVDKSMKYCPKFWDKKFGFSCYGDGTFYKRSFKKGLHHGYTYAYIRRDDKFILVASLAENTGFTRIIFDVNNGKIVVEKDCDRREILGDYLAFDINVYVGDENTVFDTWFADLGEKMLPATKKTGYTSWYNYYQNINKDTIKNDLDAIKNFTFKPDVFQIDDGFETKVGDWLSVDKNKFPFGLEKIIEDINQSGFQAGLWLAPFVCERDSDLAKNHPDWLLKDGNDTVYGGSNWSGILALDFYNKEVQDYVKKCITHYKDMGVSLFKLDFLYAVCMIPRKDKTRGEIMFEAMDFLRECCQDAQILACGVPLAPAFFKAEYCRIGMDASLSWDDKLFMRLFHQERPSTKRTILNTIFRRQLSGRAFLNDPDVFILRDYNISLTKEQKTLLATVNGLIGGLLFVSDNLSTYNEEQVKEYLNTVKLKDCKILSVSNNNNAITICYLQDNQTKEISYKF